MSEERRPTKSEGRDGARSPQMLFWVVSVVAMIFVFMALSRLGTKAEKLTDPERVLGDVAARSVKEIIQYREQLMPTVFRVTYADAERRPLHFISPNAEFDRRLYDASTKVIAEDKAQNAPPTLSFQTAEPEFSFKTLLPYVPLLIVLFVFLFILTRLFRAPGAGGGVLSFGKSRARLVNKETSKITFVDVAGIDEAKEEVREIIEFLKNPGKFQRLGGRVPRGVVLVGPPGTGKTLLAKAIAGEANVPFFSICGSDFVEMFVGVGASRVRDLFKQARDNSPCIIFLDEIDAVGRKRGTGLGGGHDEREQTLNAILVEMDGFDSDEGIIIVAATNRPDVLDPALLRPGRFDREIVLDLPDVKGREEILKVHAGKVKTGPDLDLKRLARATPSFSGAELAALVNEAAIQAAMRDQEYVTTEDMEEARDRIRWGRQKKSMVMLEEDRRITAYHEAGHALVAHSLPEVEPLHKVTIIPRGMALGATMQLPEHDRYHMSKRRILGDVCVSYGGRVAEELFCGDVTSGAREDIRRATELLRLVVCELGMSEGLGPLSFTENEEHLFLGREITRTRNHSEKLNEEIDNEVRGLSRQCYERARAIVRENTGAVHRIAAELLKREVLSGEELAALVAADEKARGGGGPSAPQA